MLVWILDFPWKCTEVLRRSWNVSESLLRQHFPNIYRLFRFAVTSREISSSVVPVVLMLWYTPDAAWLLLCFLWIAWRQPLFDADTEDLLKQSSWLPIYNFVRGSTKLASGGLTEGLVFLEGRCLWIPFSGVSWHELLCRFHNFYLSLEVKSAQTVTMMYQNTGRQVFKWETLRQDFLGHTCTSNVFFSFRSRVISVCVYSQNYIKWIK